MALMDLPHTLTVERLGASGAYKELYVVRAGTIDCFLQPANPQAAGVAMGDAFTKASRCFVDYTANVKPKDRVTIDGTKYNVSGMVEHRYGSWPHKVLTLEAIT